MKQKKYIVTLTNKYIKQKYNVNVRAFNRHEAKILAQAEAIKAGRGYEVVRIQESVEDDFKQLLNELAYKHYTT